VIDRRAFLTAMGASVAAAPLVGEAQQSGKVWRVGVMTLGQRPEPMSSHHYNAFLHELRDLGYREGYNLVIDWRHTDGQQDRIRREAASLVQWKPDVVLAGNGGDAWALLAESTSVPIVVAAGGDLVATGLASSLARPGGNVTGLQILSLESTGKRLQLIRELVPRLDCLALLTPVVARPETARHFDGISADLETMARPLSVKILRFTPASTDDLDRTFADVKMRGAQALIVPASPFAIANAQRLAELAVRHRLPDVHELALHVQAGGLISYGYKSADLFRRSARYVDRILKGARPAELPIEQPTQFELAINLKTAKALGLTIPQSLLLRADQVIQ
jgi:putative ABC transport system substrate-binding protein